MTAGQNARIKSSVGAAFLSMLRVGQALGSKGNHWGASGVVGSVIQEGSYFR
jgi:hypothetical protein